MIEILASPAYAAAVRFDGLGPQATDLTVLDDRGLSHLDGPARRDLLELLEDIQGHRSTLIASQLPVEDWHEVIANPTLADTILDGVVHRACRITLKGEPMRKRQAPNLTHTPATE